MRRLEPARVAQTSTVLCLPVVPTSAAHPAAPQGRRSMTRRENLADRCNEFFAWSMTLGFASRPQDLRLIDRPVAKPSDGRRSHPPTSDEGLSRFRSSGDLTIMWVQTPSVKPGSVRPVG